MGRTIGEIGLEKFGVELKAVRRIGVRYTGLSPEWELHDSDILVMLGLPEQLVLAESWLLLGEESDLL